MGQEAVRAFAFSSLDVDIGMLSRPVYQDGVSSGYPRYYFEDDDVILEITRNSITSRWDISEEYLPSGPVTVYTSQNDAATPDAATWDAGITVVSSGTDIPGKKWWNSQVDGLDPVWVENIDRNSLIDVPTVNPNVEGELFRTSTTILNVSQG